MRFTKDHRRLFDLDVGGNLTSSASCEQMNCFRGDNLTTSESFMPQRHQRVHARRPPCGDITR